jgi:hypothetical protein
VFGKLPGAVYPSVAFCSAALWLPLVLRLSSRQKRMQESAVKIA